MSNDVYGATVILMAVASLVAIRVSRHRVHTDASSASQQPSVGLALSVCRFLAFA